MARVTAKEVLEMMLSGDFTGIILTRAPQTSSADMLQNDTVKILTTMREEDVERLITAVHTLHESKAVPVLASMGSSGNLSERLDVMSFADMPNAAQCHSVAESLLDTLETDRLEQTVVQIHAQQSATGMLKQKTPPFSFAGKSGLSSVQRLSHGKHSARPRWRRR